MNRLKALAMLTAILGIAGTYKIFLEKENENTSFTPDIEEDK